MSHETHKSITTDWITPKWICDWLGKFDLDPATIKDHPWPIGIENRTERGLDRPWKGRVFLNPPFTNGQIEPFVKRMATHNNGVLIVAARVETGWFQDFVFGCASDIFFPRKRIQFCNKEGTVIKRCGFPSVIAFYGNPTHKNAPVDGTWISSRCKSWSIEEELAV